MAKKKTVPSKKKSASVGKTKLPKKKTPVAKKKATASTKKATTAKKKTSSAKNVKPITNNQITDAPLFDPTSTALQQIVNLLPPQIMDNIRNKLHTLASDFQNVSDNNLTSIQRRRKIGPGIRNYGFIVKVSELAQANPRFAPFINVTSLQNCIQNIEMCREIVLMLQAFARIVSNSMMVYSDDAYTMALVFYNTVREMSRRGDPEAMELFNTLRPFFRRPRRTTEEPTVKELERDLHALIHGKKDGKIVVENFSPTKSGGARKIIDDVHKSKAMIKESAEAQVEN